MEEHRVQAGAGGVRAARQSPFCPGEQTSLGTKLFSAMTQPSKSWLHISHPSGCPPLQSTPDPTEHPTPHRASPQPTDHTRPYRAPPHSTLQSPRVPHTPEHPIPQSTPTENPNSFQDTPNTIPRGSLSPCGTSVSTALVYVEGATSALRAHLPQPCQQSHLVQCPPVRHCSSTGQTDSAPALGSHKPFPCFSLFSLSFGTFSASPLCPHISKLALPSVPPTGAPHPPGNLGLGFTSPPTQQAPPAALQDLWGAPLARPEDPPRARDPRSVARTPHPAALAHPRLTPSRVAPIVQPHEVVFAHPPQYPRTGGEGGDTATRKRRSSRARRAPGAGGLVTGLLSVGTQLVET